LNLCITDLAGTSRELGSVADHPTTFIFLPEKSSIFFSGSSVLNVYAMYWAAFATVVAIAVFYGYLRTSIILRRKLSLVTSSVERHELQRQKAVFKTIQLVLLVYGVSWCIPNFLLIIVTILGNKIGIGFVSSLIAIGTGINSSCNVFIYAVKHREMRIHMRKFFCKTNSSAVAINLQNLRRSTPNSEAPPRRS
jgi:hypothetical protein